MCYLPILYNQDQLYVHFPLVLLFFFIVVKYTSHKIYRFNRFPVYSSVMFTLLSFPGTLEFFLTADIGLLLIQENALLAFLDRFFGSKCCMCKCVCVCM